MAFRFTVLASGSAGNASLLEVDGFGLLLDAGLGPRILARRLAHVGLSWDRIHTVVLTHTHGDHWKERTFAHLARRGIPLWCHSTHHDDLRMCSAQFATLRSARLVHRYEAGVGLNLSPGLRCRPIELSHDGHRTFGFRLEGPADLFGQPSAMACAADLGSWSAKLAEALADVDVLALEFNHDVEMEYASGRAPELIARVLGDHGHLSNEQAAGLLQEVIRRSSPGRPRHVIQLHLSRECNRPALAREAARAVLADLAETVRLHTARQDRPMRPILLGHATSNGSTDPRASRTFSPNRRRTISATSWLPGLQ